MSDTNIRTPLDFMLDFLKSSCPKTPAIFSNSCMQFIKADLENNPDELMKKLLMFFKSVCETCKAKKVVKGHICQCDCHILIGSKYSNHERDEDENKVSRLGKRLMTINGQTYETSSVIIHPYSSVSNELFSNKRSKIDEDEDEDEEE